MKRTATVPLLVNYCHRCNRRRVCAVVNLDHSGTWLCRQCAIAVRAGCDRALLQFRGPGR